MVHPTTCDDLRHCRNVSSIVFSCVSTIFLCTWVALHLDVARNPREGYWKRLLDRVGFVLLALLAPEAVFMWAFFQWEESCENLKESFAKDPTCTWTETHAMLASMGGFQLVSEGEPARKLGKLSSLPRHTSLPTEEEILDKSKGDSVAKSMALIQTLWFAIQAAHRISKGLDVTELELTTLGHVVLNVFIYWCWWNKPVDIRFPINVHVSKSGNDQDEPLAEEEVLETDRKTRPSFRVMMGAYIAESIGDGTPTSWRTHILLICLAVIGSVFGAIHCLAWNSTFPTRLEHLLWRICALVITTTPSLSLIALLVANISTMKGVSQTMLAVEILLGIIYSLGRICLLVLALTSLRELPFSAYQTPSWSPYIPHIA